MLGRPENGTLLELLRTGSHLLNADGAVDCDTASTVASAHQTRVVLFTGRTHHAVAAHLLNTHSMHSRTYLSVSNIWIINALMLARAARKQATNSILKKKASYR